MARSSGRRGRLIVALAVAPVAQIAWAATGGTAANKTATNNTATIDTPQIPLVDLAELQNMQFVPPNLSLQTPISSLVAQPIDAPPINGFIPQVVVGLTDEEQHDEDDYVDYGIQSDGPGGHTMPVSGSPYYTIATLDAGSQAHIITYNDAQQFDFVGAQRDGSKTQAVQGANGTENLDITDGVGVYVTGIQNATGGTAVAINPGAPMHGQWNTPILTTEQGSVIPNAIGSPILSQWQVSILNSQTRHLTMNGTTYRTPSVTLQNFSNSGTFFGNNPGWSELELQTTDDGPPNSPYFFNFDGTGADNPDSPGGWTSLETEGGVAVTRGTKTVSDKTFLVDTGAQVSVISKTTASAIGIKTSGTSPTVPDFHVDVLGVGGIQSVPGYFVDNLTVTTDGDDITLNHVPVLVLNVADPANPSQSIPGILGTNLFNNRDLVINADIGDGETDTGDVYLGFSPVITPKWTHNGPGTWGDDTNWSLGTPDGDDLQANFTDAITAPTTVTVDSQGFTVGQITFNNANRYTVSGSGTITIEAFSTVTGAITDTTGSHTISTPLVFNSDTAITVTPANGSLNLNGPSINGGSVNLSKEGAGLLAMTHVRAGTMAIDTGTVMINPNGGSQGASHVNGLTIAGGTTPTAKLDLTNNAMVIDYTGTSPLSTIAAQVKAGSGSGWTGNGITSSTAQAVAADSTNHHKTAVGYAEDSAIGNLTTFLGQPADSTSILLRYTFVGDANLDGKVNALDFNALSNGYGSGLYWSQGDFNDDGTVNSSDFAAMAANYGQVMPTSGDLLPAGVVVPEPMIGGGLLLLLGLLPRHRRA
jgi:hypothetical protein